MADVNGDSRADLVRLFKKDDEPVGHDQWVDVHLSNNGAYPTLTCHKEVGGYEASTMNHLADVNGDGRTDIIRIWRANGGTSAYAQVLLADANGCFDLS